MPSEILSLPGFHEPFSAISHLLGAVAFAALGVVLVRRGRGDGLRVFFLVVYSVTCVLLLSMSGVFHMLPVGSSARGVLGHLDKAAIFALIAGTHTPVQGLFFRGFPRWGGLVAMWLLAATGISLFSVYYHSLPVALGTGVYLLMGWIASLAGILAWWKKRATHIALLVWGGVVYSAGAVMMGLGWPMIEPLTFGPHELWHVAVLTAMGLHWRFFLENARVGSGPLPE